MTTITQPDEATASEELIKEIRDAYHQLVIAIKEFYACTTQAEIAEQALETASLRVAAAEIHLETLGVDCTDVHASLIKFGVDNCGDHRLQPMLEARRAQSENHQPGHSQVCESELPPDMAA